MSDTQIPSFELLDDIDVGGLKVATMRTALELDLFTHIARGATDVPTLAAATNCSERGIRVLARALLSLEALQGSLDAFANGPMAAAYLVAGAKGDTRSIYLSWLQNRDHLTEAVRTGVAPGHHDVDAADDEWQAYAAPDLVRWPELVPELQEAFARRGVVARDGAHVVDLGCGSGLVGFAIVLTSPRATITCVDRGRVLRTTRALAEAMGVADRVEFIDADVAEVDLPADSADLVLLVNVAQYLGDERLDTVLRTMRRTLRPGGTGYVSAVLIDEGTPGNQMNWGSGVEMYLASNIDQRDAATMEALIRAAGFEQVRFIPSNRFVLTK